MIVRIYSMFDRMSRAFGAVLVFTNDEVARRAVVAIIRGEEVIRLNPADFDLFWIGEMDSDSGVITPALPVPVFNCGDLVKAQEA